MTPVNIDLSRFCEVGGRPYLSAPWVNEGRTIATDGFILISVEIVSDLAAARMADHQRIEAGIERLLAKTNAYEDHARIDLVALPKSACIECNGSGYVLNTECDGCEGGGEFRHRGLIYTCKGCGGKGVITHASAKARSDAEKCSDCNGLGDGLASVQLGPATFLAKYLRLIGGLPNAVLHLGPAPNDAARFEFDGGYGFVLPTYF